MSRRANGRSRDLMQVAAAVVGAAAAGQVIPAIDPHDGPDTYPTITPRCDHGRAMVGELPSATVGAEPIRTYADGCQSFGPYPPVADVARMDVHAALNTYEARPGEAEGFRDDGPAQASVVGANGRRLILRWTNEGLWVGGCLITDAAVADQVAAFMTREADE